MTSILLALLAAVAPVRAQNPAAPTVCYKLYRLVEQKNAADAQAPYKYWNDNTSYVSEAIIPNIEGIVTPFSWKNEAQIYWIYDLKLDLGNLKCMLAKETNTIPLGPDWHRVWTTGYTFFMDQPLFFYNRIAERDYRVQMIWSREFDARKCRLPVLPKDSDRNAHFQEVED
ncbi:MAG: hypothetical protein HY077_04170 [Elusimicrobia bacterium]|nr:hypothetical protein [Elusimicrobiota bacterium]